jgi:hypothetical protein
MQWLGRHLHKMKWLSSWAADKQPLGEKYPAACSSSLLVLAAWRPLHGVASRTLLVGLVLLLVLQVAWGWRLAALA